MSRRSSEDEVQSRASKDARLKNRAVRHVSLKGHRVIKRFSLLSKKTTQSVPVAANLPNEILLLIFRSVNRRRLDPSFVGPRPKDDLRKLPLVCKGWYGAATRAFYEVIEFHRVGAVFHFYRSLKERPHLRSLVKSLYLPVRVGRDCPPHLRRVFTQILHLIESLEELHTMCFRWYDTTRLPPLERYVLPIEPNRHPDIRVLSLYGEAPGWCSLLPTILNSSFAKLETLSLRNFCISTELLADTMPIFPCLTSISWINGVGFAYLDSWLHACPQLYQIAIKSDRHSYLLSDQEEPPLRILRDNRITHLELSNMYTYDPSYQPFKWLAHCTNLREFCTNWDMLQGHATSFPLSLEILHLSLAPWNTLSLEPLEEYIKRSSCLRITLRTCKHDKWIAQNKADLQKLFESAHVGLCIEYRKICWCQPVVAQLAVNVLFPVVKWGWGHAMRLANQQTKETLEWEYPHMKSPS